MRRCALSWWRRMRADCAQYTEPDISWRAQGGEWGMLSRAIHPEGPDDKRAHRAMRFGIDIPEETPSRSRPPPKSFCDFDGGAFWQYLLQWIYRNP
jgi:hypothetical protein